MCGSLPEVHLCGGKIYYVYMNGRRYYFEYHPYLGPSILNQKTLKPTILQRFPKWFLDKFDKWRKRRKK